MKKVRILGWRDWVTFGVVFLSVLLLLISIYIGTRGNVVMAIALACGALGICAFAYFSINISGKLRDEIKRLESAITCCHERIKEQDKELYDLHCDARSVYGHVARLLKSKKYDEAIEFFDFEDDLDSPDNETNDQIFDIAASIAAGCGGRFCVREENGHKVGYLGLPEK